MISGLELFQIDLNDILKVFFVCKAWFDHSQASSS
jgi:hypothetical protein